MLQVGGSLRLATFFFALGLAACGLVRPAETPADDHVAATARKILERSDVKGGLIVHLGCGDGELTAALRADERYMVRGIDANPANVETARQNIEKRGVYGPVSVECCRESTLPFADNLVNLIVVSDASRVSRDEMLRVLAPRGVAWFANVQAPLSNPKLVKPWPSNIDEWSHWLHGPDGNPVAHDTVVGPPRQMQWCARPTWSRSHEKSPSLTGMVSAHGRVFYICDEGPVDIGGPLPDRWRLVARDAFSGIQLWKLPMPDWGWQAWSPREPMNLRWGNPRFIHRRLVAADDRVYVTLGYSAPVTALSAATGEVLQVYAGTENTCEILYHEGQLVLSVAAEPKTAINKAPSLKIMALDAVSGKRLWEVGPFSSLYDLGERGKENVLKQGHLMIAAAENHVYGVTDQEILAFHLGDGKPAWRVPRPPVIMPKGNDKTIRTAASRLIHNLGSLMVHGGRVFYAQPHASATRAANNVPMTLLCLAAGTGKEQWRRECGDWSYTTSLNVYAIRGLIWVYDAPQQKPYDLLGLAPQTGEVQVRHDIVSVLTTKHHHRCYRNKATENFLLMGKEGVEYVDLESGAAQPHRWLRGMCLYGVMPANGLLYVPPHSCSCNPMTLVQGYWAFAPASSHAAAAVAPAAARLERGPAYGIGGQGAGGQYAIGSMQPTSSKSPKPQFPPPHVSDWPMYRHDPLRSGAASCSVDAALEPCWRTKLGGKLTAPIVADGRVYLARSDAHELLAIDARQGNVVWRYHTGGPVDTPPTFYQGMLLAGCCDGSVYCLRAADGKLRWRFQAAPQARSVVAEDRLESAWPVHGSVMIHHGVAYLTAGRSSYLDGGIRFYMLDPSTGEVLNEKTLCTEQRDQDAYAEGVLSDLLVSDGEGVFMRHLHLDPKTLDLACVGSWSFTGPQPEKPRARASGQLPTSSERYVYLRSGQGFLDDSLYGRTQFHLEGGEYCHLLSFDRNRSYGFQMSTSTGHFVFHTPGGKGYSIVCFDRNRSGEKGRELWTQKLPLRVYGMVLAGENLFLAGVPDVVDAQDPLASFEGRMGGRLVSLETRTGKKLPELKLDVPPVFDSLMAADGKLYFTDMAGDVHCFAGRQGVHDAKQPMRSRAARCGRRCRRC
jgi:outer membrane protein assembly factor BamB/SAM-dependent methyltransferase